ncbi:MAG: GAP1-N1 domain-containing protein, partial [Giesbergeria sp.]
MGIIVHQALHGYSEGHRQFACSAELTPNDARLVLVMSDASGSGVTAEGISYLTGYPLPESGLYALART